MMQPNIATKLKIIRERPWTPYNLEAKTKTRMRLCRDENESESVRAKLGHAHTHTYMCVSCFSEHRQPPACDLPRSIATCVNVFLCPCPSGTLAHTHTHTHAHVFVLLASATRHRLRRQLQLFVVFPRLEVIVEEVNVDGCLYKSCNPCDPRMVPWLGHKSIDPVQDVKRSVCSEREHVIPRQVVNISCALQVYEYIRATIPRMREGDHVCNPRTHSDRENDR